MTTKSQEYSLQQNQYLQASHSILNWIESAKSRMENVIDEMPNCFVITDASGEIKRANTAFAALLGLGTDTCLGQTIFNIFCNEDASLFRQIFARRLVPYRDNGSAPRRPLDQNSSGERSLAASKHSQARLTVETVVTSKTMGKRNIVWQVSKFDASHKDAQGWFTLIGTDVTELRFFESQLSQIFAALPVGVLMIDEKAQITSPHSARAAVLLGQESLAGRNLHETLFAPCWESITPQQKSGIGALFASLGAPEIQFELIKDEIPKLLRFPTPDRASHLWLSVNYQPRSENGLVTGFLVLIEDRTALEVLNQQLLNQSKIHSLGALRYTEIMNLDASLLASLVKDLSACLPVLSSPVFDQAHKLLELASTLHGLAGTARFARLTHLTELCIAAEAQLHSSPDLNRASERSTLESHIHSVCEEAQAALKLAQWALACASETERNKEKK